MDDYDILSVIGSGATAIVKLAREKRSSNRGFFFVNGRCSCRSQAVPYSPFAATARVRKAH